MKNYLFNFKTFMSFISLGLLSLGLNAQFTLQIFHASDLEGGTDAIAKAPHFAAIIDTLEESYPNTIKLSAGDNWISGPFYSSADVLSVRDSLRKVYGVLLGSSRPVREGAGRVDITIMNTIGFHASALGNHEFDLGTNAIRTIIGKDVRSSSDIRWTGNFFPYLSANLDFSQDGDLSGLYEPTIKDASFFNFDNSNVNAKTKSIAPATIVTIGGQKIGVVGATTPMLARISSPGNTTVKLPGANTNDMIELAKIIQPYIDSLVNNHGVNKVILVSHMQQYQLEVALAPLLNDVDVIIAGGSDAIFANSGNRLRSGDKAVQPYPVLAQNKNGNPVAIVSVDGQYSYVGRLVLTFSSTGIIDTTAIDRMISRPFPTDSLMVDSLYGFDYKKAFEGQRKGDLVKTLTDAVSVVVSAKDAIVVGKTDVYLEGRREKVRTEETNFGNLSCDANLWQAKQYQSGTMISLKNGGGIRAAIGEVIETAPGVYEYTKPIANPISGKKEGEVSQLDMENTMKFNNRLTIVDLKPMGVKAIFEHGLAAWAVGSTPGQMCQIGGARLSFDPSLSSGSRIHNFVIVDSNDNVVDTIVKEGQLHGDTNRIIKLVTLNFLANGGDGYPFSTYSQRMVQIDTVQLNVGNFNFTVAGSEQDALAEYMFVKYGSKAYKTVETPIEKDERIQNLMFRPDGILPIELDFDEPKVEVNEEAGTISVSLNYDNKTSTNASVKVRVNAFSSATEGTDFTISNKVFTANAGMAGTFNFDVVLTDDAISEDDEYIILEVDPIDNHLLKQGYQIVYVRDNDRKAPTASKAIELKLVGSYKGLDTLGNSTEIVAYDPVSKRLFVANSSNSKLEILDFSNPNSVSIFKSVDLSAFGEINSVAVKNGKVACAMEASVKTDPGKIVFYNTAGGFLGEVNVGVLPDMVAFTPDGMKAVVACEGEPNDDYDIDPEGSISIVDLTAGVAGATVTELGFTQYNSQISQLRNQGVRIFGNYGRSTVAQDMEPEYVTISKDGKTAYIACQENNAIVIVDLVSEAITDIKSLGTKDHKLSGNSMDCNRDLEDAFFGNFPVKGFYMPDAIASYEVGGKTYIISANEGDSRDYDGYSEEVRLRAKDIKLDKQKYPNADMIFDLVGDVKITLANGDTDGDGDYDEIYTYGGRSFSIWDGSDASIVYDSGNEIELIANSDSRYHPLFNSNNDPAVDYRDRTDDKGPEPESVVIGTLSNKHYAFVGAERSGGIYVYDVTNPTSPQYVHHHNNRDTTTGEGDLGPEGLVFISHKESPTRVDMLVVANEVSSTLSIYHVFDPQLDTTTAKPNPVLVNEESSESGIKVYPNPSTGIFNVTLTDKSVDRFEVYNLKGEIISTVNMKGKFETDIDLSQSNSGLYILRAIANEEIRLTPLMKH